MKTETDMPEQFTLGIEEEFQIVDPHTRELRSHVSEILAEGKTLLGEQVKPEMIQSMIEVGTGICKAIKEARTDSTNLRGLLAGLAHKNAPNRYPGPFRVRQRLSALCGTAYRDRLHR